MSYMVFEGQNIVDVCLQTCGTLDALVQLCDDNNVSLNVVLEANQGLIIKSVGNKAIVSYFSDRNHRINTGEKPLIDLAYRITDNDEARIIENQELRLL